jgi:regulator of replication initiation timing
MALTPAERQAAAKARKQEIIEKLTENVEKLTENNAKLQAENKALVEKIHRMEIAALKAQLKKA